MPDLWLLVLIEWHESGCKNPALVQDWCWESTSYCDPVEHSGREGTEIGLGLEQRESEAGGLGGWGSAGD